MHKIKKISHAIKVIGKKRRVRYFFFPTFIFLLCAAGLSWFILCRAHPLLVTSTDNAWLNNGPVTIIDLVTGDKKSLMFVADGCDGLAFDSFARRLRFSCRIGQEPYAVYDLVSKELKKREPPFALQASVRAPLACTHDGECYYGFGIPGQAGTSDGRLVVVKDGVVVGEIPLPNQKTNDMPTSIVIEDDHAWVLSLGVGNDPSHIALLDLKTRKFVGDPIVVSGNIWNMAVGKKVIAVTTTRITEGKDVLLIDKSTHQVIGSIVVSGKSKTFNAIGIAINDNTIYVAEGEGVSAYRIPDLARLAFYPTPVFAGEVAVGAGHVYVSLPNLNLIKELDLNSLEMIREFRTTIGFGRLYVAEQ